MLTKRNYNSYLLCASSAIYLLVGLALITKGFYLTVLLFLVTVFSVVHHLNFKNLGLKSLDWLFSALLIYYLFYVLKIGLGYYMLALLIVLGIFRLADYVILKRGSYKIFNYTHSLWHLVSGLAIVFAVVFA